MRREVTLPMARLGEVEEGEFLRVMLPVPAWMPNGALVTSVLVGRVGGAIRAYANVCRHHPLALDQGATSAMADDRYHLVCQEHGAVYRPTDGLCIDGPCKGERLFPAGVEEHDGAVTLVLDG